MKVRNLRMLVQYDGTEFHGFQFQPGVRTVQGELERALASVVGHPVRITGAGRTDAGVHAWGQVANFVTSCPIPPERLPWALEGRLPADIVVPSAREVSLDFHARRAARKRRYRYSVWDQDRPTLVLARYAWWLPGRLSLGLMRQAAALLVGEHDFAPFCGGGERPGSTVRRLLRATCQRRGGLVLVWLEANSFLYQMARRLVGALVAVGRGELTPAQVRAALEGSGPPPARVAPPHGLCLTHVSY